MRTMISLARKSITIHIQLMQVALAPRAPRYLRRFLPPGFLFEVFIIALGALLPESWFQIEIRNFIIITHYPLELALSLCGDGIFAVLCLLIGLMFLVSVWSFLIYLLTRLIKSLKSRFIVSPLQKLVWRCGLAVLGIGLLWGAISAVLPITSIAFKASPEVKSTVNSNTAFALGLYQEIKKQSGNLFFLPYSISASLAMTYAGARG